MITESGQRIAVVANKIIQGRHRLDPRQQKVLAFLVSHTGRDDKEFHPVTLSISEFAALTGSQSGSIWKEMEAVCTSLHGCIIEIQKNEGDRVREKFGWVTRSKYNHQAGTVSLQLHPDLMEYYLELKGRFTQIRLDKFFKFRSTYTIRFFERMEMMRGLNQMVYTMTLAALRDWLGLDGNTYDQISAFRAYVLDTAQKELDEKSDWSFSYLAMKTGRTITGFEFTLRPSRTPKKDSVRDRWHKAKPELKAKVFAEAKNRSGWADWTDEAILNDPLFWEHLGLLFETVDKGQTALKF